MAYSRNVVVKNGDHYETVVYYNCDRCGKEIFEGNPHYLGNLENQHFCAECSFITGIIDEKQFMNHSGICVDNFNVGINLDGEIEFWIGRGKAPWLRSDKDQRHSSKNTVWRTSVFEKDNYTCQDCKSRGGTLNAHHLQGYKKFPETRFEVKNGVTLCLNCHKKRHKRAVS